MFCALPTITPLSVWSRGSGYVSIAATGTFYLMIHRHYRVIAYPCSFVPFSLSSVRLSRQGEAQRNAKVHRHDAQVTTRHLELKVLLAELLAYIFHSAAPDLWNGV